MLKKAVIYLFLFALGATAGIGVLMVSGHVEGPRALMAAFDHPGDHDRHHKGGHDSADSYEKAHDRMKQAHGHDRHDEVNMPGLNGIDTTDDEVAELRALFTRHDRLRRRVEPLPDGIRTVTETDDEDLRDLLIAHVTGMIQRLEEGRNPRVMIQSPTLDILFSGHQGIETVIELTDTGIAVVQRARDPQLVAALQTHAAEVSDMAARGMQAVHERMAGSGGHMKMGTSGH